MRVFDAKVVYDNPRENDSPQYGKSLSAAFLPVGERDDKSSYVYVNGKPDTEKGRALQSLKKGDEVALVEVTSGDRKPYYVLADLSDSMVNRLSGSDGPPSTSVNRGHDTTIEDAGHVDPKLIIDRGKLFNDTLNYVLNLMYPRLTTGQPEGHDGDPETPAKPGLGLTPYEAVDMCRNMATSVYIEVNKNVSKVC